MKISIELWDDNEGAFMPTELPAKFVVCGRCEGRGTVDNLGPMTGEEYHEICDGDPDFPDDYRRGVYDVGCHECNGKRVVETVDLDALDTATRERVEKHYDDAAADAAERRHEQRMGY